MPKISFIIEKSNRTGGRILKMNGFNKETGLPEKNIILSENITTPNAPAKDSTDEKHIQNVIDNINDGREEEIPFNANKPCGLCLYIYR